MILDENAVKTLAQQAADMGNAEQQIYRRKTGEYMFCAKGNIQYLRAALNMSEQLHYIGSVKPSYWPTDTK